MRTLYIILLVLFTLLSVGACRETETSGSIASTPRPARIQEPGKTSIPFAFRGIYVSSSKTLEQSIEVAVKGDKWLIQLPGGQRTVLSTDVIYLIDHEKASYHEPDARERQGLGLDDIKPGEQFSNGIFAWSTDMFFRTEFYDQLEEVSRVNNMVLFSKRHSRPQELVTVDTKSGMITKREVPSWKEVTEQGSFVTYMRELRDVSYELDDKVFNIPEGYRLITADESRRTPNKKL